MTRRSLLAGLALSALSTAAGAMVTQPLTAAVVGPYAAQTDLPEELVSMVGTGRQRRHVG